ncbi:MAG TPA: toxin-antitoxin system HicB family antitoxin [Candidatus Sulfomarinibacteraceae bacterium]|nr:toxin-antitoxin system HicB family antitoxin [Candidatus Sulfomarinibacteraceae bacterium]
MIDTKISDPADTEFSGRFLLRIEPGLHAALRRAATASGLSLNEYCARKLAAPVGELTSFDSAGAIVKRAAALVGHALAGVVAFGSWARSELHDTSDIDLLVVVDSDFALSRRLYALWDEAPIEVAGRRAEPHFVTMPESPAPAVGLWAEAALDGVVLFARDLALHARLSAVRRELVEGRVVRKTVHGQPYWIAEG